jgi:hypothetical protein
MYAGLKVSELAFPRNQTHGKQQPEGTKLLLVVSYVPKRNVEDE